MKKIANITKGSGKPKKVMLQETMKLKEIYHIALIKKTDTRLKKTSLNGICKTIIGSIRSMGIGVTPGPIRKQEEVS